MACLTDLHYNDVIMSAMASQLTSLRIIYPIVYSGADQIKHQKLCVTGLCDGNSPFTGEFPARRANNAEKVSIWWRHHVYHLLDMITYIPSQWLDFQINPNIPKELKQVTTTAVWFSARGSDIRKFYPWFDLQPTFHYSNHNFLNTFREILSHHIWYFPRSLNQWIHL